MRLETEPFETTKAQPLAKTYTAEVAQLREQIDRIDDEIIQLIAKRIELSTLVMETKPPSQVIDTTREQAIVSRYFAKLSGLSSLPKAKRLVLGIIGASKIYPD